MKLSLNLGLNKRQKIIVTSVILSIGLFLTSFIPIYFTLHAIVILGSLAYIMSLWALKEGINKLKAVILMILPTFFTISISGYYFLLPSKLYSYYLPHSLVSAILFAVAILFGLVFYTLLLSQNVFNVASVRTIPLYRVASTTTFILTLITAFSMFEVIFAFQLLFIWNGLIIFLFVFPLILQSLWTIDMSDINRTILGYAIILSLVISEIGILLSFWPIADEMASIFLATSLFITTGISLHAFRERLSRGMIWEFVGWGVLIFLVAALSTSWAG